MRALLLAAGRGDRLRPLTDTVPKCLAEIGGRPLLAHWLDLLLGSGCVERVLINSHYLAGQVWSHVTMSRWRDQMDLVHEWQLLGTGGTMLANRRWLGQGAFLAAHADNLTDFSLAALVASHGRRRVGCDMTMLLFSCDDPTQCGIVEVDDRGIVVGSEEKPSHPRGNLANGAVYILESQVLTRLAAMRQPVLDFSSEVIPMLTGRIQAYHHHGVHRDIGTPKSLAIARALGFNGDAATIERTAVRERAAVP